MEHERKNCMSQRYTNWWRPLDSLCKARTPQGLEASVNLPDARSSESKAIDLKVWIRLKNKADVTI